MLYFLECMVILRDYGKKKGRVTADFSYSAQRNEVNYGIELVICSQEN